MTQEAFLDCIEDFLGERIQEMAVNGNTTSDEFSQVRDALQLFNEAEQKGIPHLMSELERLVPEEVQHCRERYPVSGDKETPVPSASPVSEKVEREFEEAPQFTPVDEAGETPAESPVSGGEDTEAEKLARLERQLREHLKNVPQALSEVERYRTTLQRLIDAIQEIDPTHEAARRAGSNLSVVRQLASLLRRLNEIRDSIDSAYRNKILERLKNDEQKMIMLLADISGARLEEEPSLGWAAPYDGWASNLLGEAEAAYSKVREQREEVAEELGRYVTALEAGNIEILSKELKKLKDMQRMPGYAKVVSYKTSEELIPIEDAIKVSTDRLVELCIAPAERILGEAKAALTEDEPAVAEERLESASEFIENQHLTEEDERISILRRDFARLNGQLVQKRKEHQEADELFAKLLDADLAVPERVFGLINQIRKLNSKKRGIDAQEQRWLDILYSQLRAIVRDVEHTVQLQREGREYQAALQTIKEGRERFSAKAAGKQDEEEIKKARGRLQELEQTVQRERQLWNRFKPKYERVRKKLADNAISSEALGEIRREFTEEEQTQFAKEWGELDAALTGLAGAQEKFNTAQARFDKNPLDKDLASILEGIAESSQFYEKAQSLLHHHYALVLLDKVESRLSDSSLMQEEVDAWKEFNQQQLNKAQEEAGKIKEEAIREELNRRAGDLRAAGAELARWRRDMLSMDDKPFLVELEAQLAPEKNLDIYLKRGLQQLRVRTGTAWREACMAYVTRYISQNAGKYSLTAAASVYEIERAKAWLEDLDAHSCLTGAGDGPLLMITSRFYHELYLLHLLQLSRDNLPHTWDEPLFRNIEAEAQPYWDEVRAALDRAEKFKTTQEQKTLITAQVAKKIREASLVFGAFYQPRAEAVARLEAEREKSARRRDPFICIVLAWRYLDDIVGGLRQVEVLITELEAGKPRTGKLVECITQIYTTHENWQNASYEVAQAGLKEILPLADKLIDPWQGLMEEAIGRRRKEWRRKRAEELLGTAQSKIDRLGQSREKYSALYIAGEIVEAEKLLEPATDPRVDYMLAQLTDELKIELVLLADEIDVYLRRESPFSTIEAALTEGAGFFKLGEIASSLQKQHATILNSTRLPSNYSTNEVEEVITDLKLLRDAVETWRSTLRQSLGPIQRNPSAYSVAIWTWNANPSKSPLRELREILSAIAQKENNNPDLPEEIQNIRTFTEELQQRVNQIALQFNRVSDEFSNDTARNDREFRDLMLELEALGRAIEEARVTLELMKQDAFGALSRKDDFPINLEQHTIMRDATGKPELRDGKEVPSSAEDIVTTANVKKRVQDRQRNWHAWRKWRKKIVEQLEKLHDCLYEAREELMSGGLSEAKVLCQEAEDYLDELRREAKEKPSQPFCNAAMQEARTVPDHYDPHEHEIRWSELEIVHVTRLARLWSKCISEEDEAAKRTLGQEGQLEDTLWGTVKQKDAQLNAILDYVEKSLKPFERTVSRGLLKRSKYKPSMPDSIANELEGKLNEASRIDRNNPRIAELRIRVERCRKRSTQM